MSFTNERSVDAPLSFFRELCAIPHPSGHTERVAEWLCDFAKSRGLYFSRDAHDNVLIRKAATPGMQNRPTLILQGHTDMVAERASDCIKDMLSEGIDLYTEGDFLCARGTTLGGDDGVAIAYALALLDSKDIPHPELEALFTSDEEIGLLGAAALDVGEIHGKMLVNIDSDAEGIFTVGCAGGARCDIELPLSFETVAGDAYILTLGGGEGGHSGMEIDRGRANAIKELAALCKLLDREGDLQLVQIHGGNADNAIPAEACATVVCKQDPTEQASAFEKELSTRYATGDPALFVKVSKVQGPVRALTKAASDTVLSLLCDIPVGVVAKSREIEGLVETSLNLGSVRTEGSLAVVVSVRSSLDDSKAALIDQLVKIADGHGASFSSRGHYPAWEYRGKTDLEQTMVDIYRKMYHKEPEVIVIHAGLECGILSQKIPGLCAVSIGPDNFDIHTPRERLSLSSFKRVWEYLIELVGAI